MPDRKTENLKGAMLMVLSMAAFTTNDLFVKLLGAQLPLSQIFNSARRCGAVDDCGVVPILSSLDDKIHPKRLGLNRFAMLRRRLRNLFFLKCPDQYADCECHRYFTIAAPHGCPWCCTVFTRIVGVAAHDCHRHRVFGYAHDCMPWR